jgi:hypothetical protein
MQGYLLVKPKNYQEAAKQAGETATYTKADYDKQVEKNQATQWCIQWLPSL